MKKAMFRQRYSTDGEVTVVGKVEEINIEVKEEPKVKEEKIVKKEDKKKNGRKFTI